MIWGNSYWNYLIFIGTPIVLIFGVVTIILSNVTRKKRFSRFAESRFYNFYSQGFITFFWNLRTVVWIFALILLLVGIANPKWGKKETDYARSGIDIVFMLDISKSMDVQDVKPSRLQRSLSLISILSDKLNGDRISLITFAGEANTVFSFTDNIKIAKSLSYVVNTDDVNVMGTNIPVALKEATRLIERAAKKNVVIFFFSDGENLEQSEKHILSNIEELKKFGAKIYTIGVGTPKGELLSDDKSVRSRLNEALLQKMASVTGGDYIALNSDTNAVKELEKIIRDYDKNRYSSFNPLFYKEQYWLPVLIAILLLLIETFIPYYKKTTKKRYIES
ncbi:MAG: hypothetical protein B6226_01915 [Candidatus Cloacimonetes bacterium 4572_65]|nr:MAG: hypothetical protein B6226_01915 [Candidatus Cloacimonetes bacterium 4572_65]